MVLFSLGVKGQTMSSYKYDASGKVIQANFSDSISKDITYDQAGNPIRIVTINQCFNRALPTISASGFLAFCNGDSVMLTASMGEKYLWSTGDTTQTITVKKSGFYYVTVVLSSAIHCVKTSLMDTVIVHPNPVSSYTINKDSQCLFGNSFDLKNTSSISSDTISSYLWNLGNNTYRNTLNIDTLSYSTVGIYDIILKATSDFGCVDSITKSINVLPQPTASILYFSSLTFCQRDSVVLHANSGNGFTYTWKQNGNTLLTTSDSLFSAKSSGDYYVVVTNPSGCSDSSGVVSVNVNTLPNVIASPDTAICYGSSATIKVIGANGYSWTNSLNSNIDTGSTILITPNKSIQYIVTGINTNSCKNSDTINIKINPLPILKTNGNQTICQFDTINITINGATSYSWSPPNGLNTTFGNSVKASPNNSTKYYIKATDTLGCENIDSVSVLVNNLPVDSIQINYPTSFCKGDTAILNVGFVNGYNYQWKLNGNNINNSNNNTLSVFSSGDYSVFIKNSNNCSYTTAAITITVNPLPYDTIWSIKDSICMNDSVLINTINVSGYTYSWFLNGNQITGADSSYYSTKIAGDYEVQITSNHGCQTTPKAKHIYVNQLSSDTIFALGNTIFCPNDSVQLQTLFDTSSTYQWIKDGINIPFTNSNLYTAKDSGRYQVIVENKFGCQQVSKSIKINEYPRPIAILTATKTNMCIGDSAILTSDPASKYIWNTSDSSQSIIVKKSGNYWVKVYNNFGCSDSTKPLNIMVHPLPIPTITDVNRILSTGSFNSYQWYLNGTAIIGATLQNFSPQVNGNYTVTVTDSNKCEGSSSPHYVGWVGFEQISILNNIKVYPNPTTGDLYITFTTDQPRDIYITDMNGKQIYFHRNNSDKTYLFLDDKISAGMYILKIYDGNQYTLFKICKMK